MHAEYLLFDLFVLGFPLILSFWSKTFFLHRWTRAFTAIALVSLPYLAWDAVVTGSHWSFNPAYILGVFLGPLPIEELLFFFVVPFACLFTWETRILPTLRPASKGSASTQHLWLLFFPAALYLWTQGRGYTAATSLALGTSFLLDRALGTTLCRRAALYRYFLYLIGLTLIFDQYLTARPVVLYGERYQLGLRIFSIPIEDFGYGIALNTTTLIVYEWLKSRRGFTERWIERRLGGYRQRFNKVDPSLPLELEGKQKIAVIGSGLAGITAATKLGERGFSVTLFEKNDYLGGKVGAWRTTLPDGRSAEVDHGFHAIFRHYYNLRRFLSERGVDRHYQDIGSYLIWTRERERIDFDDRSSTPVLNLLALARQGIYNFREVAFGPAGNEMEAMLRYDAAETFEEFDQLSFHAFAERAQLPDRLRLVFQAVARAFFSEPERMSMAELIKGFHSYYLSHDAGLLFDYLGEDIDTGLIAPLKKGLEQSGVDIKLGHPVPAIERIDRHFEIGSERFDSVVLATDIVGTKAILGASPSVLAASPTLAESIDQLRAGQRYAVLRLWISGRVGDELPVFVFTEREKLLDSISFYHRVTSDAATWSESRTSRHGASGVYELHCYSLPDDVQDQASLREGLLEEFFHFFPSLASCEIVHEHLQLRQDFPAFHVGLHATRPEVESPIEGLYFCGDWVKLPIPSMLMEAAVTSGLFAVNAILERQGLRSEAIFTVPRKGLLAGLPRAPKRP